jgi:hypothetical protein
MMHSSSTIQTRKAWFAWRWPEGFKCPRCAETDYCEIRNRQLLQCRRCRYQTSLIAGTILQGTKLPMRVWFRAMHLLAQGKKGLSNIELGRRLASVRAESASLKCGSATRWTGHIKKMRGERDTAADRGSDDPMPCCGWFRQTAEGKQQGNVAGDKHAE